MSILTSSRVTVIIMCSCSPVLASLSIIVTAASADQEATVPDRAKTAIQA